MVRIGFIAIVLLSMLRCTAPQEAPQLPAEPAVDAVELNRQFLAKERERIEEFIAHNGFENVQVLGSGVHKVPLAGLSDAALFPGDGDKVAFSYLVKLMSGNLVRKGTDTVQLGKTSIEVGLYESLVNMSPGESALFIVPSYLAGGVAGDLENIPPRATLLYELEMHNLK